MIPLSIQEARASFFDAEKVLREMDKAEQKSLSKAGAFVRQRARTSIRRKKSISSPGSPPSAHPSSGGDSPLKKFLYFAWDSASRSVVVGPALWSGTKARGQKPGAPEALEKGGAVLAIDKNGKPSRRNYRARPFMGPALQAEVAAGTIPEQFRGSLSD